MKIALARIVPLVALAALPFLPVACGKTASAQEPGRFYSGGWNGFSIKFPEEWQQQENFMGAEIIALSPKRGRNDEFQENVNVVTERVPSGMAMERYLELSVATMNKQLNSFKVLRQGETTIDGKDGRWLLFAHSFMGYDLKVLAYVVIDGRKSYIITCTASDKTFSNYKKRFEEIAESFRFE